MAGVIANLAAALLLASWARPVALVALRALHILQLEEYQTRRYWRWLVQNGPAIVDPWLVATGAVVGLGVASLPWPYGLIAPTGGIAVGVWQSSRRASLPAKKPLVLTGRVRRLIAGWIVCFVVLLGLFVLAAARLMDAQMVASIGGAAAALGLLGLLAWPLTSLANLLLYPVEASLRSYYLRLAAGVLRRYQPVVVGVAGSYGKTSTKTILAQILSSKYPTLATPRSFNTPMGLCRVIREQLQPGHRFFIAELGAYQRGEIRQLAKLVRPRIGILTAVGPEHLERFGSLDNVVKAEFELIEALPPDGLAIFNGLDATCRELSARAHCRVELVGESATPSELWAEDVRLTSDGLQFAICHRDGRRSTATTRLLGRHNVANILLASAAALACGMDFDDLAPAIRRLEPVEHRLQLVPNDNGVTVIDDTYNSNPRGAAAALEALARFEGARRYLVTPGMVELAELTEPSHREFGQQAAAVCDAVILIGPRRTQAIAEGLAAAGFSPDRLIVTRSLADATERLRGLLHRGDAVLFENDLPDNYSE